MSTHPQTAKDEREPLPEDEALRRQGARYRALAEAVAQIWVWGSEAPSSGFGAAQRWWEEITGQTPEEQSAEEGTGWLAAVHPDDRERVRATWARAMAGGTPFDVEYRVQARTGETRIILSRAVPVHGSRGEVREWVGTLSDITDPWQAEQAALQSAERLSLALSAANMGDWSWDAATDLVTFSQRGAEIFGIPPGPYMTWTQMQSLIHEEDRERTRLEVERSVAERGDYDVEYRVRRGTDGEERWVSAKGRAQYDETGQALGMHGVVQDVTERKRAEEKLREADRRKDEFLAMLAHELRNPLAPVRNAVEVLRMIGLSDPLLQQARGMIERQVGHMARLIDDLLDVSRISLGKTLLRKERLDLVSLVHHTVEDHRSLIEDSRLTLTLELPDRPVWVMGDPTRLSQVVGNLLQNSNKFTNPGGRVTVRLTEDREEETAVLTVEDTGIGMDPGMLARLFEPFSQADRSLDRSRGGLGLGLALVKGLVDLHSGRVQASSPGRGRGSRLTVHLPLSREPTVDAGTGFLSQSTARSLRILVVEDNRDAAESLKMLLEIYGHQVVVAETGQAGLETARRHHPDVALCDIGLPGGMDGYALARLLRSGDDTSGIHLIALTGYGQEEDRRRARQSGFDQHLIKPVDPLTLAKLLEALPLSSEV